MLVDEDRLRRFAWCGLAAAGLLLVLLVVFVVGPTIRNSFGFDSRAYWDFPRDPVYAHGETVNGYGLYRYSPAFLPLLQVLTRIPWPLFAIAWATLLFGVYVWLSGRNWLPLLAFAPVLFELQMGNINLLLAAAIVLGFRVPSTWVFVLLTKVTPGVGLLWFVVRQEWRSLAIALGATAAIVVIGVTLAPDLWRNWLLSLGDAKPSIGPNVVPIPLAARLAAAAVIVTWGARTDRRWTVIVAATLGLPTLWVQGLAMLVGVEALRQGLPDRLRSPLALRSRLMPLRVAA